MLRSYYKFLLCQTILVLLCLACYHSSLNGEFVFDDTVAIVKNKDVTQPANFTAIFQHDFWGAPLRSNDSHKSYRPFTTLMFNLEYSSGFRAKHMKIVNLIIHCINTLLVYGVFKDANLKNRIQIATICAALFAIHPVHTEAVCGIVGRSDLMFCLFYLSSLLLSKTNSKVETYTDIGIWIITSIGLFFKESAICIPLACIFFKYMHRNIYLKDWSQQFHWIFSARTLTYGLISIILIVVRFWIQGFEGPRFKPMDNPIAFNTNLLTKILSQNYLYVINLWILAWPQWLCFDWSMGSLKLITNISDLRLQAVLALYSFIIVTFLNYKQNFGPLLGFGLLIIPFLPASGIIKVGFVIAERVLYVPSIGFCFLVAFSFVYLQSNIKNRWLISIMKCLIMLLFASFILRTRQRAYDWINEERLFTSALNVCPNNAKVHYNIARLASENNKLDKAFHHYHKSIELFPEYESALMNLGNLYRETGNLASAEKYIKKAIKISPKFAAAWMNLGIVQSAKKEYANALNSYQNALKYRKNYAICHYNLGNLFLDQKLYSEAMQHWQESVRINPIQAKAWTNILMLLDQRGLYEDVIRLSDTALSYLANETSVMFIRANVLGKLKQYVESENLYKRILQLEPLNMLFHTNLGVLYHRWGKIDSAIESYHRAVEINTDKAQTARINLAKLLSKSKQSDDFQNSKSNSRNFGS